MLSRELKRDMRNIAVGTVILSAAMVAVFALLGRFGWDVLWGALLGTAVAVLNFILLSVTVNRALDGGKRGAQTVMGISYLLRLILIAAMVVFAIKSPKIYYVSAVIPLIFPQCVILFLKTRKRKTQPKKTIRE